MPAWRRPAPVKPQRQVLTVSELTSQIKDALEPEFFRVLVRGEVSNFRGANSSGHLYFSLKDKRAAVEVKVWATTARTLKFALKEGQAVIIEGALQVYEPHGRYSIIVNRIEPEGVGARALAFEQLKEKLAKEGLIGEGRTRARRPLPPLPGRIGVVTSVTGAALQDFLKVLYRRHPRLQVVVADARVQGDGAAFEVRRALTWLARARVELIVVTRGGGSVDDLWTFNEEAVARAVWACPVPVVSAVGHEIDVTLCDLVADHRAPTPSAAAELVAPVLSELESRLATLKLRLHRAADKVLLHERSTLRGLRGALADPRRQLAGHRLALSELNERLHTSLRQRQQLVHKQLSGLKDRLARQQPRAQLRARRSEVERLKASLQRLVQGSLKGQRESLTMLNVRMARQQPRARLSAARAQTTEFRTRLREAMRRRVAGARERSGVLAGKLDSLSPLKVLGRGYAIALKGTQVIRSAGEVKVGDQLVLKLHEGEVPVQVVE